MGAYYTSLAISQQCRLPAPHHPICIGVLEDLVTSDLDLFQATNSQVIEWIETQNGVFIDYEARITGSFDCIDADMEMSLLFEITTKYEEDAN